MSADYWQVFEQQLRQQMSAREVRYICPYCGHEIDEHAACCGEKGHAMPMTEGEDE